jgi:hypothetical protein
MIIDHSISVVGWGETIVEPVHLHQHASAGVEATNKQNYFGYLLVSIRGANACPEFIEGNGATTRPTA